MQVGLTVSTEMCSLTPISLFVHPRSAGLESIRLLDALRAVRGWWRLGRVC